MRTLSSIKTCETCVHSEFKKSNDLGKCIIGGKSISVPTRKRCFCSAHKEKNL